ncbi:MAG: sensor histidine kinase [Alphaproteobacteria bacterium]|nr:sensor histidine kinase [Alphaproteobacteria bacterium]
MQENKRPTRRRGGSATRSAWFGFVERLSFRARLAILLALLLVPVILAFGALAIQRVDSADRAAKHQAQMALAASSVGFRETLEGIRSSLAVLAAIEMASSGGAADCGTELRRIVDQAGDRFVSLLIADGSGDILCSSTAGSDVRNVGAWGSFRAAQSSGGFAIGGLAMGPIAGIPVVAASYPLMMAGKFSGAVIAGVRRDHLLRAGRRAALPRGGAIALIDSRGDRLSLPADPADGGRRWSWPLPPVGTVADARDSRGRAALVAATELDDELKLAIMVPAESLTRVSRELWTQGALMVVLLGALIGTIAVGFSMLVVEPIRALRNAVADAADTAAVVAIRAAVPGAPIEIRNLASAFERASSQIKEREQRLVALATQREALLRELNHRVRNNLQVVSSLLRLQSRRATAPDARQAIRTAEERVRALAILHRHLFANTDSVQVNLRDFVSAIGNEIYVSLEDVPARERVTLVIDLPHQPIDADVAIPLGLIIAEAMANSLRHGYPPGRGGQMKVSWSESRGRAQFVFADDGIGFVDTPHEVQRGLGRTLIEGFAGQLGGTVDVQRADGCRLQVDFPWARATSVLA